MELHMKRYWKNLAEGVAGVFARAAAEGLWRFLLADLLVWLVGSFAVYALEAGAGTRAIRTLGEALYFGWISMTTVGFGDITAVSAAGRAVVMVMVFAHIFIIALLSAAVASMLVAQRLKEGKGLEKVRMEGHLVICGWNSNGQRILSHLQHFEKEPIPVVLVSSMSEEEAATILEEYKGLELKWVSGDYVHESVLERANIKRARGVIILADYKMRDPDKSDERAILTTLAVKEIRSDLMVSVEVFSRSARPHLRRARADEIIVAGESDSFFLLSATLAPGLNRMIRNMLSPDQGLEVWVCEIPRRFVGRPFSEYFSHAYGESGNITLGVITHEPGIGLTEVLSDDYTQIDRFIEEKFKKAKLGSRKLEGYYPRLNPPLEYIITENDVAVCLQKARSTEE